MIDWPSVVKSQNDARWRKVFWVIVSSLEASYLRYFSISWISDAVMRLTTVMQLDVVFETDEKYMIIINNFLLIGNLDATEFRIQQLICV